jgi:hypothetical protein
LAFDLENHAGTCALKAYAHYGKVSGVLRAAALGLPSSRKGFVVEHPDDDLSMIAENDAYRIVLCRPDAPMGQGNQLPRGRDLGLLSISSYLQGIQRFCPNAIVLAFIHPSIELLGRYAPRYETTGAANVLIHRHERIVFEYVGPGFDVGDITRGKAAHASLVIPWEHRFDKPSEMLREARAVHHSLYHVSRPDYLASRRYRIKELAAPLGESSDLADRAIPSTAPTLTLPVLDLIHRSSLGKIHAVFGGESTLAPISSILMNLYATGAHVFEIWESKRSTIARSKGVSRGGKS